MNPNNMNIAELTMHIEKCKTRLKQLAHESTENKSRRDLTFRELTFGHKGPCNQDPDSPLLITAYESGHLCVWVPVFVNDFSVKGRPYQKNRYFNGQLVTTSSGEPVTDTVVPHIVGRTQIRSSLIPFRDRTLTGFASLQIGTQTTDEIEQEMHSSSHVSLQTAYEVLGAEPDSDRVMTGSLQTPKLTVTDDTDEISTSGDFTPSETLE